MHELSITEEIVAICLMHAAGQRVQTVMIEIGDLSGFVPEAVEFCFAACSKDTPLEGARLLIERIPGKIVCTACNTTHEINGIYDPCPRCGSYPLTILSGEELRVKELEVEN